MVMVSTVCLKNGENKDKRRACLQAMIAVYLVRQQQHGRFYHLAFTRFKTVTLKKSPTLNLKRGIF